MRTTLNIDDELLKAAKIAAVHRKCTLTKVIEEGLRKELKYESRLRENRVWGMPAHMDGRDTQTMVDWLKHVGDDLYLQRALGPFPTREGNPLREFDWADSSALLEELEGPFARS